MRFPDPCALGWRWLGRARTKSLDPDRGAATSDRASTDASTGASIEASTEAPSCWVCLNGAGENEKGDDGLVWPCRCPRAAHRRCLARWQLQSAGRTEESTCRFCGDALPDWRPSLTPDEISELSREAVMAVVLNGVEHRIRVSSGTQGRQKFEDEIRERFEIHTQDDLEFTFECEDPTGSGGERVVLEGRDAFDAAFHCAAITASQRRRESCVLGS